MVEYDPSCYFIKEVKYYFYFLGQKDREIGVKL